MNMHHAFSDQRERMHEKYCDRSSVHLELFRAKQCTTGIPCRKILQQTMYRPRLSCLESMCTSIHKDLLVPDELEKSELGVSFQKSSRIVAEPLQCMGHLTNKAQRSARSSKKPSAIKASPQSLQDRHIQVLRCRAPVLKETRGQRTGPDTRQFGSFAYRSGSKQSGLC